MKLQSKTQISDSKIKFLIHLGHIYIVGLNPHVFKCLVLSFPPYMQH